MAKWRTGGWRPGSAVSEVDMVGDRLPADRDGSDPDRPAVRNEFSGSASTVAQIGQVTGQVVFHLPRLPEPAPRIPRQVPPADRWFTNRVADLARLDAAAATAHDAGQQRVVLVTGVHGVGKSALVHRWAHTTDVAFPGGQLYVDFAGQRTRPGTGAPLGEALAGCLVGLGVAEEHLPATFEARTSLYRTRTGQEPILVVLDGVTEEAQVRALLPQAPGSVIVATSDRRLGDVVHAHGAELMVVDPLDPGHARELLRTAAGAKISSADPADVDTLVRLCGGLPPVLRVAASRLLIDRGMQVADLVAAVTADLDAPSADDLAATVSGVLTAAYRRLPAPAARAYRLFGLAGGLELTVPVVAVALDVAAAEARTAVTALVTANLVDDRTPGRYRPHALVARHAAAMGRLDEPPEAAAEALRRVVWHYLVHAMAADRMVMGRRQRIGDLDRMLAGAARPLSGATAGQAQQWLADERGNLRSVVRLAAELGWDDAVWSLAEALAALYLNQRRPYELIEVCRAGAAAAARLGQVDAQARLLCVASRGQLDLGRIEPARADLDAALAATRDEHNPFLLASVLEHRGRLADLEAEQTAGAGAGVHRAAAIEAYQRSLQLNEQAGEERGAALARFFLGGALAASGRHEEALALYREAAAVLSRLGDERMLARVEVAIGAAIARAGDDAGAAPLLRRAIAVLDARRLWHYEAQALEILAEVAARLGRDDEARAYLDRAATILERSGDRRGAELRARSDDGPPPATA